MTREDVSCLAYNPHHIPLCSSMYLYLNPPYNAEANYCKILNIKQIQQYKMMHPYPATQAYYSDCGTP